MSKNVLLISHFPPPYGGIATWTKRVIEHGIPGYEIHFVNSSTINGRDPVLSPKRSLITELKRARSIYRNEKKFLKNKEIDVVHDNIPCTLYGNLREIITARIAKKHKVPFILHCRCTVPVAVNSKFKRFIYKRLLKLCTGGVIVLNQKSYDFIKSLNPNVNVKVIPNFVSIEEIDEKPIINQEITKLSYVGGVIISKGCKLIMDVAPMFPNIYFELVGDVGPEMYELEKPNNVNFYGAIPPSQAKDYLKTTDGFLFLSKFWGEGFSNSLAEAMASGLPCIVTDWAANKDMIENKGGVVIDIDSKEQLINAIKQISDKETRINMSKWNIQKVKDCYNAEVVINSYANFYDEIRNKKRGN